MQDQLRAVVVEFTRTLLDEYDLAELLHRITGHAVAVARAEGAGIMLVRDGSLEFAAASDEVVTAVERIQDRIQSGVCHEAFVKGTTLAVSDLRVVDGWPEYRERALELGLRSVLGLPLNAHGSTIGVLNVYREQAGPWSDEDVEACEILAAMAGGYVLFASALQEQVAVTGQLEEALSSRAVIEQAKGVLMAREQLDADTAFAWLREASMTSNRKLRDVANDLVERATSGV